MKKRLLIAGVILGFLAAPTAAFAANTLDPARLQAISQRCASIQGVVDQLQRRDLVARTNRGRSYEAQIKQIDALTTRLHNNNIPTQSLDGPAAEFKAMVDRFRAAYVAYDDRMTALRQIDCRNKPADFATALEEIRVRRQEVGAEVTRGEAALSRYREAVSQLRDSLPDAQGGSQ